MQISETIEIVPLSKEYLKQASKLVRHVFDDEDEPPTIELEASIDPKKFSIYVEEYDEDLISLEYFIAVENKKKVIGTIGLYSIYCNFENALWIGWYCVDKKYRGKGIGIALLNFAIKEAKNRGMKYLCLYTSTKGREKKAQEIYEKNGFFITQRIKKKGYEKLYRKKIL
ncbi:MAG: GNAT family N-acetyltransferase [Clostridium sp.]